MESVAKCRSTCSRIYLWSVQRSQSKECRDDIISYSILPLLKLASFTPCPTQRKTLHCFQQSRVFRLNTVSVDVLSVFKLVFGRCFYPDAEECKGLFTQSPGSSQGLGSWPAFPGRDTPPQAAPLTPRFRFPLGVPDSLAASTSKNVVFHHLPAPEAFLV